MKIELENLIRISNVVAHSLELLNVDTIELSHDYYWEVEKEERYNPLKDPSKLTLGQLTFDWEFLNIILEERVRPPLFSDFQYLAAIYRAIGDEMLLHSERFL